MFETLESGAGLEFILQLEEIRNPVMDALAHFLNWANYDLFYIAVLALIYLAFNKRLGLGAFFALVIVIFSNTLLKEAFGRPRPFVVSEEVDPLFITGGYGIPSGHTMVPLVVFGYLALWSKRWWIIALAAVYVLMHAFARMYTGVHFPQDIVAGLFFGLLTLAAIWLMGPPLAKAWQMLGIKTRIGLAGVTALIGLLLFPGHEGLLTATGLLTGGLIAQTLEMQYVRFQPPTTWIQRVLVYLPGITLSVGVLVGLDMLFELIGTPADALRVLRYTLVTLTALVAWPELCVRFGWMTRKQQTSGTPQPT
jgi:membrane-associated phospholipid phosphatase